MTAQDDMYFVPSKANIAKEAETYGMPKDTYYAGSSRTVDDYNRRVWSSVTPVDSAGNDIIDFSAVRGVYPDSTYIEEAGQDDYKYTRRMSRFEGYTPSEAYWDGYRDGRWSSPWHYSSWYSWYDYDPWYWNYPYYHTWYTPWYYGAYYPWRYAYYGYSWYYPHHYPGGHHQYTPRPVRRTTYSSGRSFGERPGGRSSYGNTRSFGSPSSTSSRSSGSFGGSFGGSRSGGGGSFGGGSGGGRSASGGRTFGGRR